MHATNTIATRSLSVSPLECVVDDSVFDAWSWCASDTLEWRLPDRPARPFDLERPIEGDNPPGLVFVLRDGTRDLEDDFLPTELARLHAVGYGLGDERALAPWAIDDATDRFHARRVRPRDVLWLAADSLAALVWGLHDWAHFHNHGPFDQPAMTELQCDLVALAWLRANAEVAGLSPVHLERVARSLAVLSRQRFISEGVASPVDDLEALFRAPYPRAALT
jgi:hypothetical protein